MTRHLPNAITLLNLVSGVFGIICATRGDMGGAFIFMMAAAVFDVLDGAMARVLKAYSAVGKELDSLSDLVSFGVLPALMLFYVMQRFFMGPLWLTYIPLALVPCAALRLARFNLDETQAHSFKGLPVPAAAMLIGSTATVIDEYALGWLHNLMAGSFIVMPVMIYIVCRLMLSRLPMVSLKSFSARTDSSAAAHPRGALITVFSIPIAVGLAVLIAFAGDGILAASSSGVCAFAAAYIVVNLCARWHHRAQR